LFFRFNLDGNSVVKSRV